MRRDRRRQLLESTTSDLKRVADKIERAFSEPGVSVLASRAELERCGLNEILSM